MDTCTFIDVAGFPYALFVSLCIHAFLEHPLQDAGGMTYGVAIPEIPITFIFTGVLEVANKASIARILLVIGLFACVLGSLN
jgi:hypothetical protein